jgi:hypothetical protein
MCHCGLSKLILKQIDRVDDRAILAPVPFRDIPNGFEEFVENRYRASGQGTKIVGPCARRNKNGPTG